MQSYLRVLPDEGEDTKMQHLIETLCNRLRCSMVNADMDRVAKARDMLTKFQHREIFERVLGPGSYITDFEEDVAMLQAGILPEDAYSEYSTNAGAGYDLYNMDEAAEGEEEGEEEQDAIIGSIEQGQFFPDYSEDFDDLPENSWHGFFRGYQILNEEEHFNISENKKCIEIASDMCDETLEAYMRYGVKCFCIDLFVGSIFENQQLVVRLRQTEIKISREIGYPLSTTLFAKMSPRLQYTGDLNRALHENQLILKKDDMLILTTERGFSNQGSTEVLFVNATYLLDDVKNCDVLCIGQDIQVVVVDNVSYSLECRVLIGGPLTSRMPVLFPARCDKFHISIEELEDITFCKELGINIIVSHIIGSREYLKDLAKTLRLFNCGRMRIWAGARLNELKGCGNDYQWAVEAYDGFLFSVTPPLKKQPEILHLCPAAVKLIEQAFETQKPIVFDAIRVGLKQYIVNSAHYPHIFYYPDKFLFRYSDLLNSFRFFVLQEAINAPIIKKELSKQPYCDKSLTGSDSLARASVAAAFEMRAKAIIVLGLTGRMATKLAHFRPQVPIIFVTQMGSASRFVQVHHNVNLLYYIHKPLNMPHSQLVYKHFLYGLTFIKQQNIVRDADNVILIYGKKQGTKFPDRYISYKFDQYCYPVQLKHIIEPKLSTYGALVPLKPFVHKFPYKKEINK